MLKSDDSHLLLEWARDLGKTFTFLDLHVHPYEVLGDDVGFKPSQKIPGLFTKGLFTYHSPAVARDVDMQSSPSKSAPNNYRGLLLAARLLYGYTGPKVFLDQLNLVGLSGALLLPVARTAGKAEQMLQVSQAMFQMDKHFFLGCAFPVGIQPDKLRDFFHAAQKRNGIRAIKLYPSLVGIDPLKKEGQGLITASLAAAGELNLPMVVHGGRTPGLEPVELREYSTISRLETVNWSLSAAPVILAHAGCYGLTHAESIDTLCRLNKLLDKHSNLMADISGLDPPILRLVLEKIDLDRLVFGSDALYTPIWKAWLRFLKTLRLVFARPDNDLVRIAALNPARCLSLSAID